MNRGRAATTRTIAICGSIPWRSRDAAKGGKAKEQSEIIRIRTYRNGGAIAELHQQSMGIVGNKPVTYFLGMRCDIMKRQIKQFFAAWIKVK